MWLKNNVPNLITSMNLLCGTMSVMAVANHEPDAAGLFIFIAAIFDFLDGMAARLLNARSEIGKQLDSLADMISFGLAPGLIMFDLISGSAEFRYPEHSLTTYLPYIALAIPVFSAWRLAKFNIDERQADHFIGLPTPANAMMMAAFPMILKYHVHAETSAMNQLILTLNHPLLLSLVSLVFSLLLVSNIRLFSLKFKYFRWKDNQLRILFLLGSGILLLWLILAAIPLIIITYIIISLFLQKSIKEAETAHAEI